MARKTARSVEEVAALSDDELATLLGPAMSHDMELSDVYSASERHAAGAAFLLQAFQDPAKLDKHSLVYIAGTAEDFWRSGVHELLVLEYVKRLGCTIEQRPTLIPTYSDGIITHVQHLCWWALRKPHARSIEPSREYEQRCVPWCRPNGFTNDVRSDKRVY